MERFPEAGSKPSLPNASSRSWKWVWYFVALVGLTVTAVVVLRVYLSSRQLTKERLAEARTLWEQNGPRSYDMDYTVKKFESKSEDRYSVQVRSGAVVFVTDNGQPLESRQYRYHDMRALFGFIDDFLEKDSASNLGTRAPTTLFEFDPRDGHLVRYVRSMTGKPNGVEITIERFRPLPAREVSTPSVEPTP